MKHRYDILPRKNELGIVTRWLIIDTISSADRPGGTNILAVCHVEEYANRILNALSKERNNG